jgi:hypothetical protein
MLGSPLGSSPNIPPSGFSMTRVARFTHLLHRRPAESCTSRPRVLQSAGWSTSPTMRLARAIHAGPDGRPMQVCASYAFLCAGCIVQQPRACAHKRDPPLLQWLPHLPAAEPASMCYRVPMIVRGEYPASFCKLSKITTKSRHLVWGARGQVKNGSIDVGRPFWLA